MAYFIDISPMVAPSFLRGGLAQNQLRGKICSWKMVYKKRVLKAILKHFKIILFFRCELSRSNTNSALFSFDNLIKLHGNIFKVQITNFIQNICKHIFKNFFLYMLIQVMKDPFDWPLQIPFQPTGCIEYWNIQGQLGVLGPTTTLNEPKNCKCHTKITLIIH